MTNNTTRIGFISDHIEFDFIKYYLVLSKKRWTYIMNRKPFGKKCKCGHFESDHVALKQHISIPGPHDLGILLPHPPDLHSKRGNCKICKCNVFVS